MPSPRFCHWSLTSRANSASSPPGSLLSRPTPRISRSFGRGVAPLGDQRHLAVVVVEADARQPLVRRAAARASSGGSSAGARVRSRQRLVEPHHQRLVLRADRADHDRRAVRHRPAARRTASGTGGSPGAAAVLGVTSGPCSTTRASSAISPSRRREQRVDVDLLDPRLLDDELAEPHQQLLQRGEVHRLAAAHALAGRCRSSSAPSSAGRACALSGGRPRARSLNTSTSCPPVPNSSTGPNCGSMLLPTISS